MNYNYEPFYKAGECFLCLWKLDVGSQLTIYGAVAILIMGLVYILHCANKDRKLPLR